MRLKKVIDEAKVLIGSNFVIILKDDAHVCGMWNIHKPRSVMIEFQHCR